MPTHDMSLFVSTYTSGKVDGRFTDLVQEEVRRHLHEQVSHEQDTDRRLELVRVGVQFEIPLQSRQTCRRNVVSINVVPTPGQSPIS